MALDEALLLFLAGANESYVFAQRYRQYVATKMITPEASVTKTSRMGRKKRWPERTAIKLAAGTFDQIAAVLDDDEDRMTFMREAVEHEIERREAAGKRKRAPETYLLLRRLAIRPREQLSLRYAIPQEESRRRQAS